MFSFRNEEEVIPELIRRTRLVLRGEREAGSIGDYHLIFVNDDSTDRSLELLLEQDKGHGDIRVINMSRRFGVSPCVLAGMAHCSADLVVYLDADLQDPPEVIPRLLQAWREGENIDVVHTRRLSRAGESRIKLLITRIGYHILHRASSIKLPIETGDFKLLTRRAVHHLLELKEKKPYLRGLVCWVGFKQASVEYHREPRYSGRTKFPVFSLPVVTNFLGSALISFSAAPLHVSTVVGLLSLLGCLGTVVCLIVAAARGQQVAGWAVLTAVMLFVGGVQLLCMGIIGLYLDVAYQEAKRRPNYIVASTYGFDDVGGREDHPLAS